MEKLYSPNAPFKGFKEQISLTTRAEFGQTYERLKDTIASREGYEAYLAGIGGRIHHEPLLGRLYREARRILILGAGNGQQAIPLVRAYPGKNITLSDLCPEMLESIQPFYPISVEGIDARRIPHPAGSFDLVCAQALEYVFDDKGYEQMAAEMARVTCPGGRIFISTVCLLPDTPQDLKGQIRSLLSRVPALWVVLYMLFTGVRIKWTGYRRTLAEHRRILASVPHTQCDEIVFDHDGDRLYSVAFLLQKLPDTGTSPHRVPITA